jgi:hypothetical protein
MDASDRIMDASDRIMDASERIMDASDRIMDASDRIMDASDHIRNDKPCLSLPFHEGPQCAQIIREAISSTYFISISFSSYFIKIIIIIIYKVM